jgi:hypothetical protein
MKKETSISEIEQADLREPIWALNGSAQSEVNQAGAVYIAIPKLNGNGADNLVLPQTWLPICITEAIPKAQLLACTELRTAVNNRLLVLITKEYAQELLQQKGVEEERQRLIDLKRHIREATAARSITESGADITLVGDDVKKPDPVVATQEALSTGFVMYANSIEPMEDIATLNSLRNRGRFSKAELLHLQDAVRNKEASLDFIKSTIVERKAAAKP